MVRVLVPRSEPIRTMAVTTDDGRRYSLHSAPSQFEFTDVARFGSIDREGLKPITRRTGPGLKTLSFAHTIANRDYQRSIEHVISPLMRLGRDGERVRFVGGSTDYEQGVWWNIKDLKISVEQRALDNRISRAVLSWSLEEAVDLPVNLIRSIPRASARKPAAKAARQMTVKQGHTLFWIAFKYLGNGSRWPEIFALNRDKITNPNRIVTGWVLKLPVR